MKKLLVVLLALMLVVSLCACGEKDASVIDQIKKDGKIIMLTNAAFAPFEYLAEDGSIAGVDVEISEAIAAELGVELEVVDMDFDGIIEAIKSGKGHLGVAGITNRPDRAEKVNFSINYVDTGLFIVVPEGSAIAAPADLAGKSVGVQLGTTSDTYCTEEVENCTVAGYKTVPDAIAALAAGKVDAVVADEQPAREAVANTAGLTIIEEPLTSEQYAIAIAKENEDLVEVVNTVLQKLIDDGTVQSLIDKHMAATDVEDTTATTEAE